MNIKKTLTIILALAMIFTVASPALAGRGGGGKNCDGGMGYGKGHGGRHGGHGMMGLGCLKDLDLTQEQKERVAGILKGYLPEMKTKTEAMKTQRMAMMDAMAADDATETAVLKAYQDVAAAGEALAVLRFQVMTDVKKVLTDAQIAAMKEKRAGRAERMQGKHQRRWDEFEQHIDDLTQ